MKNKKVFNILTNGQSIQIAGNGYFLSGEILHIGEYDKENNELLCIASFKEWDSIWEYIEKKPPENRSQEENYEPSEL